MPKIKKAITTIQAEYSSGVDRGGLCFHIWSFKYSLLSGLPSGCLGEQWFTSWQNFSLGNQRPLLTSRRFGSSIVRSKHTFQSPPPHPQAAFASNVIGYQFNLGNVVWTLNTNTNCIYCMWRTAITVNTPPYACADSLVHSKTLPCVP